MQINNAGQVIAADTQSGNYYVRVWGPSPGSSTDVALGGTPSGCIVCISNPYQFSGLSGFPSLNNPTSTTSNSPIQAAYTGIGGLGSALGSSCANTCLAAPNAPITTAYNPSLNNINADPLAIPLRPMVADNGSIVIYTSTPPTAAIQVLAANLATLTPIAPIATTAAGSTFTQLGNSPGVSDDGTVVAFAAITAAGPGVFISYNNGSGFSAPVQVAGLQVGQTANAELGYSDPDPTTGALTGLYISSVNLNSRVAVIHQQFGDPGFRDDAVVVSFIGTPSGPSKSIPALDANSNPVPSSTPLFFSANLGLWTVRVDFDRPKDPGLSAPTDYYVHVNSVLPVVQVGDTVQSALGPQTITALSVNDQLAAAATDLSTGLVRTQRRGDHRVGFYAQAGPNNYLIIRGSHLDSNQDGLLDHWKEQGGGIDINRNGIPTLSLYNWGASTSQRDLFLEMDWAYPRYAGDGTQIGYRLQPPFYLIECLQQFYGPPVTGAANPVTADCGGGAPALTGNLYGVRSDGADPDDIPAGITLHIDAGLATDYENPSEPLSLNTPGSGLLGGNDICAPAASLATSCVHPDVIFFGVPSLMPMPPGVAPISLGMVKDAKMVALDPARELAFHYIVLADFWDVERVTAGAEEGEPLLLNVLTATNVTEAAGQTPVGQLTVFETSVNAAALQAGTVFIVSTGSGAGTIRTVEELNNGTAELDQPWPTDGSGNVLVQPDDQLAVMNRSSGKGAVGHAVVTGCASGSAPSSSCDYGTRPASDVIVALGALSLVQSAGLSLDLSPTATQQRGTNEEIARTLAHELGHNFGLLHSGINFVLTSSAPLTNGATPSVTNSALIR